MGPALLYHPEPERGGGGKNVDARKAPEISGFSEPRLRQVRSVLRHSHELALAAAVLVASWITCSR
jgi:hypothetical protein